MNPLEGLQYQIPTPDRRACETEIRPSVGIVTVIYQPNNQTFLVVREKHGKEATGKKPGEISFPAETRKQNESPHRNILGALAEGFDDTHLEHISLGLHLARYYSSAIMLEGNKDLPVDIAFFLYDGPQISPRPTAKDEVDSFGWVSLDQLESLPVRSVTRDVMATMKEKEWIREAEETYRMQQLLTAEMSYDSFSLERFYIEREYSTDVRIEQRNLRRN